MKLNLEEDSSGLFEDSILKIKAHETENSDENS
jgi:hypothetical protein